MAIIEGESHNQVGSNSHVQALECDGSRQDPNKDQTSCTYEHIQGQKVPDSLREQATTKESKVQELVQSRVVLLSHCLFVRVSFLNTPIHNRATCRGSLDVFSSQPRCHPSAILNIRSIRCCSVLTTKVLLNSR